MKTDYFKNGVSEGAPWGVLGKNGQYKPRFGLWVDTSDECQQAIKGTVAEGWDFDLIVKWASGERQRVSAKEYVARMEIAGQLEPLNYDGPDYIREVFIPENFNLRRRP
jgi:hypothetical protein